MEKKIVISRKDAVDELQRCKNKFLKKIFQFSNLNTLFKDA